MRSRFDEVHCWVLRGLLPRSSRGLPFWVTALKNPSGCGPEVLWAEQRRRARYLFEKQHGIFATRLRPGADFTVRWTGLTD